MANEKRLIDANALKESVMKEIRHYWNEGEGGYYLAEDVIPDIDDAPTVDAVEVVRCRICKNYNRIPNIGRPMCTKFLGLPIPKPDDFCSYGERKDGDGNG